MQQELAEREICTLLDMHQDQLNGRFGTAPLPGTRLPSRGFPAWLVSGASVASGPTAGRVVLCSEPGATDVSLVITPERGGVTDLPGGGAETSCAPAAAAPAS